MNLTHEQLAANYNAAINAGQSAVPLTESAAIRLKGKRINVYEEGYKDQCFRYELIVGDIIEQDWIQGYEPKIKVLTDSDGNTTTIRMHYMLGNNHFSCTDSDRVIRYVVIN